MTLLEVSGNALFGLVILVIAVMVGTSIILAIIGLIMFRKKPTTAKVLFILAGAYLLIAGGICGVLMGS